MASLSVISAKATGLLAVLQLIAACAEQPETKVRLCLYEMASCSDEINDASCPPMAPAYVTYCSDGDCAVKEGVTEERDPKADVTFYYHVSNPRQVEGVTCEDWRENPTLDPEPPVQQCASENDGLCDVPGACPEGTDLNDCAGACVAKPGDSPCVVCMSQNCCAESEACAEGTACGELFACLAENCADEVEIEACAAGNCEDQNTPQATADYNAYRQCSCDACSAECGGC